MTGLFSEKSGSWELLGEVTEVKSMQAGGFASLAPCLNTRRPSFWALALKMMDARGRHRTRPKDAVCAKNDCQSLASEPSA
jgi:hypothetical protein